MLRRWVLRAILGALVARADITYTVDDSDGGITYSGTWEFHYSVLDYGGAHALGVSNAQAVFTFTGVSVSYLAPKWPYRVDSYISLDGGPRVLIDMTAPSGTIRPPEATVGDVVIKATVLWSAEGLTNTRHTLTITQGPSTYAIVDGFRYTTTTEVSSSTGSLLRTASSTQQNSVTSTSQQATTSTSIAVASTLTSLPITSGDLVNNVTVLATVFSTVSSTTSEDPAGASTTSPASTSSGGLSTKTIIITAIAAILCTALVILLVYFLYRKLFPGARNNPNPNNATTHNHIHGNGNQLIMPIQQQPQQYRGNRESYGYQYQSVPAWHHHPGGTTPLDPALAPYPAQSPASTPSPRVPYYDLGANPVNPMFDPHPMSQFPAAMHSVTTLLPVSSPRNPVNNNIK